MSIFRLVTINIIRDLNNASLEDYMYTLMSKRVGVGTNFIRELSGNNIIFERDLCVDSNNNIYTTGIVVGSNNIGHSSGFVTKHDSYGDIIWSKIISGASGTVEPYAICSDSIGNIYIVGITRITSGNDWNLIKLDSSGNILWQKKATDVSGANIMRGMKVNSVGDIVACGQSQTSPSNSMLAKFNSSGSLLMEKSYNSTVKSSNSYNAISFDSSDNIYTCGISYSSGVLGAADGIIAKHDTNGVLLWAKNIGDSNLNQLLDIVVDDNYGYSVGTTNTPRSGIVTKFSKTDGSIIWQKTIDTMLLTSITIDQSGNLFTIGWIPGMDDLYIFYMDNSGNVIYQRTLSNQNPYGLGRPVFSKVISNGNNVLMVASGQIIPRSQKSLLIKFNGSVTPNTYGGYILSSSSYTVAASSLTQSTSTISEVSFTPDVFSSSLFTSTTININPPSSVGSSMLTLDSNTITSADVRVSDSSIVATNMISNPPGTTFNIRKYNSSNSIVFNNTITGANVNGVRVAYGSSIIGTVCTADIGGSAIRPVVICFNQSTGNINWKKYINTAINNTANTAICVDSSDNIIVSFSNSTSSICIMKFDANGNIVWQKSTTSTQSISAMTIGQSNDIYTVGTRNSADSDIEIMRFNSSGVIQAVVETSASGTSGIEGIDRVAGITYDPTYSKLYVTFYQNNTSSSSSVYDDTVVCFNASSLVVSWKSAISNTYSTKTLFSSVNSLGELYVYNGRTIVKYTNSGTILFKKHCIPYTYTSSTGDGPFPRIFNIGSSIVTINDHSTHTMISRSDSSLSDYLDGSDIAVYTPGSSLSFGQTSVSVTTPTYTTVNDTSLTLSAATAQYYDISIPIKIGLDKNIINF